jgi:hypothetical protein
VTPLERAEAKTEAKNEGVTPLERAFREELVPKFMLSAVRSDASSTR